MLIYTSKLRFLGHFCLVLAASPTFFNGLLTEYADDGHSPGDTFYCVGGMSGLRKKSWTIL
ncbi:hypothetical protein SAMN05216190_11746 [Pseudomonas borbori]|uniref:RdRp catalytic domain-containing protein n=1 Tax=Pseudomonas borbori TaxID=289003 RepID=A0A1I5SSS8_9PSED|nr:hypothetical protein SAMN05216190_11746 [Pseudomonas borbori]